MKVTPHHFAALSAAIAPLDTNERRERYIIGDYPRSQYTKDINARYRWDLFWEGVRTIQLDAIDTYMAIFSDYTNAHLDTALRNIVPPL